MLAVADGANIDGVLSQGFAERRLGERGHQARLEFSDVSDSRHSQGTVREKQGNEKLTHWRGSTNFAYCPIILE